MPTPSAPFLPFSPLLAFTLPALCTVSSVSVIIRFPSSSIVTDLTPTPVAPVSPLSPWSPWSPVSPFTSVTITVRSISLSTVNVISFLFVSESSSPPMYQPLRIKVGSSVTVAVSRVPSRSLSPLEIFSLSFLTERIQPSIVVGNVTVYSGISSIFTKILVSALIAPVL